MRLSLVAVATLPAVLAAQTTRSAALAAATPNRTYDAVVEGMSCKQQPSGQMDCEYKVGTSVRFVIAGVGQQDVSITFYKVSDDGDYHAAIAPLHGCVVVKPAVARADSIANYAFVSPLDGKIHRNWNSCLRQPPKRDASPGKP